MASKRKMNGCKSVKRVMDAINKIGCEVQDFFERARHVVDVPPGFNPTKEAIRFNLFRAEGVAEYPDYQIPPCVIEFAETIHAADCPKKFYADLQSRIRTNAHRSARAAMTGTPPKMQTDQASMMRPTPAYA